jgi:hypothetical protein
MIDLYISITNASAFSPTDAMPLISLGQITYDNSVANFFINCWFGHCAGSKYP